MIKTLSSTINGLILRDGWSSPEMVIGMVGPIMQSEIKTSSVSDGLPHLKDKLPVPTESFSLYILSFLQILFLPTVNLFT